LNSKLYTNKLVIFFNEEYERNAVARSKSLKWATWQIVEMVRHVKLEAVAILGGSDGIAVNSRALTVNA
jgi:hypothetical protein